MLPQPCPNCGRTNDPSLEACAFCGQDLTSRGARRRAIWFWVGVALLIVSGLFWVAILWSTDDQSGSFTDLLIGGAIINAVPIGFGIYCIRRGRRREPAVDRVPVRGQQLVSASPGEEVQGREVDRAAGGSWLGRGTRGAAGALGSVVVIIVLRLVIGAVFDGGDDTERISERNEAARTGRDVASESAEPDQSRIGAVSIFDIRVGDCLNLTNAEASEVDQVILVRCSEAWRFIVLNLFVVAADGEYPGVDYFVEQGSRRCDSNTTFNFYPIGDSWKLGDRTVTCLLESGSLFTPKLAVVTTEM